MQTQTTLPVWLWLLKQPVQTEIWSPHA